MTKRKAKAAETPVEPAGPLRRVVIMLDIELVIALKTRATRESKTVQRLASEIITEALQVTKNG